MAHAVRLWPRAEVRGEWRRSLATVAEEGQWRLLCLAHVGVGPLTRWLALHNGALHDNDNNGDNNGDSNNDGNGATGNNGMMGNDRL